MAPVIGSRWVRKGCNRPVIVLAVRDAIFIEYRYIQGIGGKGLWRRCGRPPQTISIAEWADRFVPEKAKVMR